MAGKIKYVSEKSHISEVIEVRKKAKVNDNVGVGDEITVTKCTEEEDSDIQHLQEVMEEEQE